MQLLERHFEIALETPDGIRKLRELILTLAMQGKLVPQDPEDQPASELLKEIEAEKKKLFKEGIIKKQETLPLIKMEEIPYEVPKNWNWVRLNQYGIWKSGSTPSRNNSSFYGGNIPWVKSGEVKQGKIVETNEKITEEATKDCPLTINPIGSVLIAMYGANIGDVGVLEIEATTNQAVCACKTYSNIYNIFLYRLLQALKPIFIAQGAGAAQPNISREKIINQIVPLPPLTEQKRIVAQIDKLMALCDKLEIERNERNQKRLTIHTAAMNRLLSSSNKTDFDTSWGFITKNFNELYSVPENVAELKKAILQLAVMGKLVPQDPNDQPASELLKEIEAEKKRLVKEGKIKKQEPLPQIKQEEIINQLPRGWALLSLLELGYFLGGKTPSTNNPLFWNGTIPWVSPKDMKTIILKDSEDHITLEGLASGLTIIPKSSILIVVRSGILRRTFPVAINEVECTINQDLKALVPFSNIYSEYVMLMLQGFENYILTHLTKQGMTVESVTFSEFVLQKFPLPPLAEQKRIIAKVDQLMILCKSLEQQVKDSIEKQTEILNAILAKI